MPDLSHEDFVRNHEGHTQTKVVDIYRRSETTLIGDDGSYSHTEDKTVGDGSYSLMCSCGARLTVTK